MQSHNDPRYVVLHTLHRQILASPFGMIQRSCDVYEIYTISTGSLDTVRAYGPSMSVRCLPIFIWVFTNTYTQAAAWPPGHLQAQVKWLENQKLCGAEGPQLQQDMGIETQDAV